LKSAKLLKAARPSRTTTYDSFDDNQFGKKRPYPPERRWSLLSLELQPDETLVEEEDEEDEDEEAKQRLEACASRSTPPTAAISKKNPLSDDLTRRDSGYDEINNQAPSSSLKDVSEKPTPNFDFGEQACVW
jgi:hypothetical protein